MELFNKDQLSQKFSVLYVEDQEDIQDEFVEILSLFIDETVTASNGQEGLQMYRQKKPDLIITDIQMPVMTGLEMIKEIRQVDTETPIIVTTAFNDNKYLIEAIDLGIEYYLLKPVMLTKLEDRLSVIKKRLLQDRELEAYHSYLQERVQEEIALREAKESLLIQQNKSAEVGQMVSVIAHQWKQPLHFLHLLLEDLALEFDYQPLSKAYIDDFVKKGTDRIGFLSKTMDNFLHFYKGSSETKDFSVAGVTNEIVLFLFEPFKSLGIDLVVNVHKDFQLRGIDNEFQQVILNIINNAKEAIVEQKKTRSEICVDISVHEEQGILRITDSAGGIPENIIKDIFKLEYTTKSNGNGIGLYLVQKIAVQRFKGTIEVDNTDAGASFTLTFNAVSGE